MNWRGRFCEAHCHCWHEARRWDDGGVWRKEDVCCGCGLGLRSEWKSAPIQGHGPHLPANATQMQWVEEEWMQEVSA